MTGGIDQHKTTHSNDEGELILGKEGVKRIDERFVRHDIQNVRGGSLSGGYVGGHEVKEVQREWP